MKIRHRPLLTEEQISQLEVGKMYGLYREPGSGKTYFFKNVLLPYCRSNIKTALFLVHRLTLKEQTNADLEEEVINWEKQFMGGGFVVTTYQAIEYAYKHDLYHKVEHLLGMDFVVCDEAHYFVKDSWNEQTDYSVQFMEDSAGAKLFMTGTPKEMFVLNQMWDIETLTTIDRSNNNILAIRVYDKPNDLINDISRYANDNCKVLSFVSGYAKNVLALKEEHGGSFIVSKNHKEGLYEFADKELINIVVKGEKRPEKGILPTNKLWSTSVWNEGVNIIDPDLKVVCSFQPRTSTEFIQQAARARRSDILLCIVAPTKKMLAGYLQKYARKLEEIYALREEKNNPDFARMSELYFLESIRETELMLEYNCFASYVQDIYKNVQVTDYGQVLRNRELSDFLSVYADVKMFDDKQELFKQTLIDDYGYRDEKRRKVVGIKSFNKYLQEVGINYEIVSKRESSRKSEHFTKTYWMVKSATKNEAHSIYIANASNNVASIEDDFEKQINAFKFKSNEVTATDAKSLMTNMLMKKRKGI